MQSDFNIGLQPEKYSYWRNANWVPVQCSVLLNGIVYMGPQALIDCLLGPNRMNSA